jgi:hypothetical protein
MSRFKWHDDGKYPRDGEVFVFGSDMGGSHTTGASRVALKYFGAKRGKSEGYCGSRPAHCYAIPTKDRALVPLTINSIKQSIERFVDFAHSRPDLTFFVTRVGCGVAGYPDSAVAPLFKGAPEGRCSFAHEWRKYIEEDESGDSRTVLTPETVVALKLPCNSRVLDEVAGHVSLWGVVEDTRQGRGDRLETQIMARLARLVDCGGAFIVHDETKPVDSAGGCLALVSARGLSDEIQKLATDMCSEAMEEVDDVVEEAARDFAGRFQDSAGGIVEVTVSYGDQYTDCVTVRAHVFEGEDGHEDLKLKLRRAVDDLMDMVTCPSVMKYRNCEYARVDAGLINFLDRGGGFYG